MNTKLTTHPHKNNAHKNGYDFNLLVDKTPSLQKHLIKNQYNGQTTIDFTNAESVKILNSALLSAHYNINNWTLPKNYLCPPIPGRVDYIHHLNDLLKRTKDLPPCEHNNTINVLDIGTGASCIYPILGQRVYNWHFVASDIDPISIQSAQAIINANDGLLNAIECRLQSSPDDIFANIIQPDEFYHLTLCNPPFHKSIAEAQQGTQRKWKNLNNKVAEQKQTLNFGGQKAELWCKGGELAFIKKMIKQSQTYAKQVLWFTCLVSQKDHVRPLKMALKKANVSQIEVVKMSQGNKISRFIAWRYC